jgi:hypothetical protein
MRCGLMVVPQLLQRTSWIFGSTSWMRRLPRRARLCRRFGCAMALRDRGEEPPANRHRSELKGGTIARGRPKATIRIDSAAAARPRPRVSDSRGNPPVVPGWRRARERVLRPAFPRGPRAVAGADDPPEPHGGGLVCRAEPGSRASRGPRRGRSDGSGRRASLANPLVRGRSRRSARMDPPGRIRPDGRSRSCSARALGNTWLCHGAGFGMQPRARTGPSPGSTTDPRATDGRHGRRRPAAPPGRPAPR